MLSVHNLGSSYFCFSVGVFRRERVLRTEENLWNSDSSQTSFYPTAFIFWDTLI